MSAKIGSMENVYMLVRLWVSNSDLTLNNEMKFIFNDIYIICIYDRPTNGREGYRMGLSELFKEES